jgi:hypothetical protein
MSSEVVFAKDDSLISHGVPAPDIMVFPEASALRRTVWAPGLGLCSIKECLGSDLSWHKG